MQRLALVWTAAAAFTCQQHNLRTTRRRTIRRLFLEEATFKEDALIWAKETSRTQTRPMTVAAALYDDKSQCVFVGGFDDAALAVAALCRKHGRNVCKGLRYEDFTAARAGGDEDDFRMMQGSIIKMWLDQATEENGGLTPIGNREEGWSDFDATSNPFLAGVLGSGEQ